MIENKKVLSGVQASGKIHLGNYFGAIKQFVDLQENNKCLFFVANYHSLTTVFDAKTQKANSLDIVLDYLSLGLDPNKSTIFMQSDSKLVLELAWILSNVTPMGLLERAHSYKDKIAKGISPNVGLFYYPILMAADILLYDAEIVPVGKDQKQHLEITRDIAIKFNQTYDTTLLKLPEPYILENLAVVPGIDGQKMSKSYNNALYIFDQEKELKKKIASIVTDSKAVEDKKDPDSCNIFNLYKLLANKEEIEDLKNRYLQGNMGYKYAKDLLLEKFLDYFKDARIKKEELLKNLDYVHEVLNRGKEFANILANRKMEKIRKKIGI
jgi:tryptophanyl-tRNA synthetase